jgi:hypothetical protein
MRMMLLLAASLGALAIVPTSASADGGGLVHSHALSSFGLSIVVRDAPKVVQHRPYPVRHLRPQPWPRRFLYHAPRSTWHKPWHARPWRFDRSHGSHQRWSGDRGRHDHPAARHHGSNRQAFDRSWRHDRDRDGRDRNRDGHDRHRDGRGQDRNR